MWAVGGVLFELMTGKAPWTGVETGKILFTVSGSLLLLIIQIIFEEFSLVM